MRKPQTVTVVKLNSLFIFESIIVGVAEKWSARHAPPSEFPFLNLESKSSSEFVKDVHLEAWELIYRWTSFNLLTNSEFLFSFLWNLNIRNKKIFDTSKINIFSSKESLIYLYSVRHPLASFLPRYDWSHIWPHRSQHQPESLSTRWFS